MQDSLEQLLKDIYALEPSLRERDTEIRPLVRALLLNKPEVKVSEEFTKGLRTKLLAAKEVTVTKSQPIPSPWMNYFLPLGAMAVLLLILVPGYVGKQTTSDRIEMNSSSDTFLAPEAKRSGGVSPEGASMMMEDSAAPMDGGGSLIVSDQGPGVVAVVDFVSLTLPSFIVIMANGNSASVLGVSYLLFAGNSEQIEIPLTRRMEERQYFTAALYFDNGDGVFDIDTDIPVYDADGLSPISQTFSITPQ